MMPISDHRFFWAGLTREEITKEAPHLGAVLDAWEKEHHESKQEREKEDHTQAVGEIDALGQVTDVNDLADALGVDRKTILNAIAWHEGMKRALPPGVMRLGRRIKIEVQPFLVWLKTGEAGR